MKESGYYPPGAEFDANAPWNQENTPEVDVDVTASTTLSKSLTISTDDYRVESWEDWDTGDEGETIHTGGTDYDFSNTDFEREYRARECTPLELIEILRKKCEEELNELLKQIEPYKKGKNYVFPPDKRYLANKRYMLMYIIESCKGWTEDEFEVIKD